jgi:hypothetical protein
MDEGIDSLSICAGADTCSECDENGTIKEVMIKDHDDSSDAECEDFVWGILHGVSCSYPKDERLDIVRDLILFYLCSKSNILRLDLSMGYVSLFREMDKDELIQTIQRMIKLFDSEISKKLCEVEQSR